MAETDRIRQAYDRYRAVGHPGWNSKNLGNQAMLRERQLAMSSLLANMGRAFLESARVLDVGCGAGFQLAILQDLGARPDHLIGVDLLEDRIAQARSLYPAFTFISCNAEALPYPDGSFDIALVGMLFSSILSDSMATRIALEIDRVLRPDGIVFWYDFRFDNPWNSQVRGMPLHRIKRFFPTFRVELQRITLLPPLSRRLGKATPLLYPALGKIPLLQTHYIGLLRPTQNTSNGPTG